MSILRFGRGDRERDPLLARVAELPQAIEPARDLWPEIRARLEEQPRVAPAAAPAARRVPASWALAAGVAVAAVAALFTWLTVNPPGGEPAQVAAVAPAPAAAIQPVAYGSHAAPGPEYLETRARLLELFQARLASLPPETRERVEHSLAAIQQAANDIDAALAEDPSSQLLNSLLLSTRQEELRLYMRVAAPQPGGHGRT